jgi:Ferritin-like
MTNSLSICELTDELAHLKERDPVDCIKRSLRAAIKLEFATIPPYLVALWSIRNPDPTHPDAVWLAIREIVVEEMLHLGLACNMLAGLGELPVLAAPGSVPVYPGPLPGDVNPDLEITLRRLTPSQLKVFMDIEYPEGGPISVKAARSFDTIGEFYRALLKAFEAVDPALDVRHQRNDMLTPDFTLFYVANLADVRRAINLIRLQGEGSNSSPEETPGHLAHFYAFRQVYVGATYVLDPITKRWGHTGPPMAMPPVWPMADIPDGGYQKSDVPFPSIWDAIEQFDVTYTSLLVQLEQLWRDPTTNFHGALVTMYTLNAIAVGLISDEHHQRPDRRGTYGPCFRLKR